MRFWPRPKSKEEQSIILHYQKEQRDKIRSYRALELDLLEKLRMKNEEKEAQLTKVPSVVTSSAEDKGKGLVEDHP